MIAFETKYVGPSNFRPSRIAVSTSDANPSTGKKERAIFTYNSALNSREAHMEAAAKFAAKFGFDIENKEYVLAGTEGGFIFTPYRGEVVVLKASDDQK